jgi:hypothetical protein
MPRSFFYEFVSLRKQVMFELKALHITAQGLELTLEFVSAGSRW